jgi:hypothetical protein
MSILDRINEVLQQQGFSNALELGQEIEDMDSNVENKDRSKFDKILDKYLKRVDPKSDMSILQAVKKLGIRKGLTMYNELSDLHYHG